MNLQEEIAAFATGRTRGELQDALKKTIENYGFSAFCFLDISEAYRRDFSYFGSTGEKWEQEYIRNDFFEVDEVLKVARRTNNPFSWSDTEFIKASGGKTTNAQRLFDAAKDYRFNDGYVIPLHFVDQIGRYHSASCSLMWSEGADEFKKLTELEGIELHILLTYWIQRVVDIRDTEEKPIPIGLMAQRRKALEYKLSDRERDVLAWAARGKTSNDTAEILKISVETVNDHIKHAIRKLNASNKTHAVTQAILLGLVDP